MTSYITTKESMCYACVEDVENQMLYRKTVVTEHEVSIVFIVELRHRMVPLLSPWVYTSRCYPC